MPGAGFKRHALKARELIMEMLDMPLRMVKENRVSVVTTSLHVASNSD
jgi:hypothetical protein